MTEDEKELTNEKSAAHVDFEVRGANGTSRATPRRAPSCRRESNLTRRLLSTSRVRYDIFITLRIRKVNMRASILSR